VILLFCIGFSLDAIPTVLLAATFRQELAAVNALQRIWRAPEGHQLTYCAAVIYVSDHPTYEDDCGSPISCQTADTSVSQPLHPSPRLNASDP
jgi:hypothetical protein